MTGSQASFEAYLRVAASACSIRAAAGLWPRDPRRRPGDGGDRPAAAGRQPLPCAAAERLPARCRGGGLRAGAAVPDATGRCRGRAAGRPGDSDRRGALPAATARPARPGPAGLGRPHPARRRGPARSRARRHRPAARPARAAAGSQHGAAVRAGDESAAARADLAALDIGVRAINSDADRGPGPAHGPVRGLGRGQERAAGHDGALHRRRRDRGRADRRARARSQGIHRTDPGRGRPGALGGGGGAGRQPAAAAAAGCGLHHR